MIKSKMLKIVATIATMVSLNSAIADQDYLYPLTSAIDVTDKSSPTSLGQAGYNFPPQNFWTLRQWNNTSNLIPSTFPVGSSWEITNPNTRIKYYPLYNSTYPDTYELATANVPCGSGPVTEQNELDMFIEAKDLSSIPISNLGSIGQLLLQVGTNVSYSGSGENGCSTNRTNYIISVVLNTTSPYGQQTLYVQINVGGSEPSGSGLAWCPDYEYITNPDYNDKFCVDDFVSSYGGTYVQGYGNALNSLDILPRLTQIIKNGHAKPGLVNVLNNDPSQWKVGAMYFGTSTFGNKVITTQWYDPKFKESGGAFCSGAQKTQFICEPPKNPSFGWTYVGDGCYHRPSGINC